MKIINNIWDLFSSVKLALFVLSSLAITSIVGTVIPQSEPSTFYIQNYGVKAAKFIQILNVDDMYHSWWFLGLLGLLCGNLVICSIDRLPKVLRIITADNTTNTSDRLVSMANSKHWTLSSEQLLQINFEHIFLKKGLKIQTYEKKNGRLFFLEKGRWSRLGVYVVHLSILVIFAGAIIGHFTGFKGSVMVPELQSTSHIFANRDSTPIDLGFEVRCNSFGIEFYPNTMPKDYKSSLTILENGKEILTREIEINSPLTYRGITFYQSSYQAYRDFIISIQRQDSNTNQLFSIPFQAKTSWKEEDVEFGILNAKAMNQRVVSSKLWLKVGNAQPTTQWLDENVETNVPTPSGIYKVKVKQRYATGLQVSKDPGVYVVYFGCGLMLFGLYMAFFMSHWRIWCFIKEQTGKNIELYLAGSANKNRPMLKQFLVTVEEKIDRQINGRF